MKLVNVAFNCLLIYVNLICSKDAIAIDDLLMVGVGQTNPYLMVIMAALAMYIHLIFFQIGYY